VYKLSALDAGFLYNESARCPQHVASVQVLELPEATDVAEFIAQFKSQLQDRIHLVPYFTNRLQFVPFDLDHPVWVKDSSFNIDNHVHHAEVAFPGGRRELEAKVAEIHAQLLDRSRPLWDIWVLTGLEGGRIAYYNRAHHACLDGMSGQVMLETIMDATPVPRDVEPPARNFFDREDQSIAALVAGAMENFARFQVRQASRWMDHVETSTRIFQRVMDPSKGLGAVADTAPATRFNRTVFNERAFVTGELSLVDVKRIAKATGTKINDVFLTVCSGGLRRYLERSAELPAESLIAGCPVSLRQPGDTMTNNQVTMMLVNLASREANPMQRLYRIAASSAQAKHFTADMAGSYEADVSVPGLPAMMRSGAELIDRLNLADLDGVRIPFNVVVSNVPGPRAQLYSNGARVLTHYPVSIPAHGLGVNITVQSYMDQLFFAITACAKALPDPDLLRDDMLAAFAELLAALAPVAAAQQEMARIFGSRQPSAPRSLPASRVEPDTRAA